MSRQVVCDHCGRPERSGECWLMVQRWSTGAGEEFINADLCSFGCLAAWAAARPDVK